MPATAGVIGGGVVGSASALALQRAGFAVTLIDPMRAAMGASWGNAGHIAIEQVEPLASRAMIRSAGRRLFVRGGALDFRLRDADRWLPFAWRLMRATSRFEAGKAALSALLAPASAAWRAFADGLGAPELYRESGHFVVWETGESATKGLAQWRAADTGAASFRAASADEMARIGALMRKPPAGAIRFGGTGQISDPTDLAEAMARAFVAGGGTRRYERAAPVRIARGRAEMVLESGEVLSPDVVLVAAGARSAPLMRQSGYRVPLIAERGYHIQAPAPDWPSPLGPIVFEDRSMIVTPFRSGVRAASFVEFARADAPPDARKWARLRAHVEALGLPLPLPGVPWMGARPTLPDYLPAIGRAARAQNLLYAFGHQHLGLTLAPITARIVAQLASGATPEVPIDPFALERFG